MIFCLARVMVTRLAAVSKIEADAFFGVQHEDCGTQTDVQVDERHAGRLKSCGVQAA